MSAPALLVAYLRRRRPSSLEGSALQPLASPEAAWVTRLLAAGELAVDKVPGIPARTEPGGLLARALSGGLAGAALSTVHGKSKGKGGMLGAAAAVASAFVALRVRRALVASSGLPDPAVALIEDAIVVRGGRRLMEI